VALRARCGDFANSLDAYVDRELDPSRQASVEQHLSNCASCAQHVEFSQATKTALRAQMPKSKASDALRARIIQTSKKQSSRATFVRRAVFAGGALAAGSIGLVALANAHFAGESIVLRAFPSATATADTLLEELASLHARPLPPEETDPARVSKMFSPIVGVPVRPLALPSHRMEISRWCCLRQQKIMLNSIEQIVYTARAHGYPLAVSEGEGVGYVVSGDANDNEVAMMAAEMPSRSNHERE
jgi:anti-sigma factor RsiW